MPVTIGLLVTDSVLILIYGILGLLSQQGSIVTFPASLRLDVDWGLGEMANYLKWIAISGLSLLLLVRSKAPIFLALAVLALVALLDDSLQLHERFGDAGLPALLPQLQLPAGVGELAFMMIEGVVLVGLFIWGWASTSKAIRRQVVPILALLGGAVFCAAGIDFFHTNAPDIPGLNGVLIILEDGGEMIFLSLVVGYVAGLVSRIQAAT